MPWYRISFPTADGARATALGFLARDEGEIDLFLQLAPGGGASELRLYSTSVLPHELSQAPSGDEWERVLSRR